MKAVICFIFFLSLISCNKKTDCFDCYLSQYPKDSRKAIIGLHSAFEEFLENEYSAFANPAERLNAYSIDLLEKPFFFDNISNAKRKEILTLWSQSGLKDDFKDCKGGWFDMFGGPYFLKLKNCLDNDTEDSLVYHYINSYHQAGDLSPNALLFYLSDKKNIDKFSNKMHQHLFILEYFIPRMCDMMQRTKKNVPF